MSVELTDARKNKKAFRNLLNAYLAELSQYNRSIRCNPNGVYEPYLANKLLSNSCDAYLVYDGGELAGFAAIGRGGLLDSRHNIEEFYVIPAYRNRGIGYQTVCKVLSLYRGKFHLHMLKNNANALRFWQNTLRRLKKSYAIGSDSSRAFYMVFNV